MKKKSTIYRFLLHYGISSVLLLMMIGIAYMLQVIQISNKTAADVLSDEKSNTYIAYVDKNNMFKPELNHSVEIDTPDKKRLFFKIKGIQEESSFFVLNLTSETNEETLTECFAGNTKLSGYIFTNKIKLWDLLFSKWTHLRQ